MTNNDYFNKFFKVSIQHTLANIFIIFLSILIIIFLFDGKMNVKDYEGKSTLINITENHSIYSNVDLSQTFPSNLLNLKSQINILNTNSIYSNINISYKIFNLLSQNFALKEIYSFRFNFSNILSAKTFGILSQSLPENNLTNYSNQNNTIYILTIIILLIGIILTLIYTFRFRKLFIEKVKMQSENQNKMEVHLTLFNSSKEAIAIIEKLNNGNSDSKEFKIIELNKSFEKIANCNRDEIINNPFNKCFPEIGEIWVDIFNRVLLTNEPKLIEYNSSLENRNFEIRVFKLNGNKIATIFIDMTAKNNYMQELLIKEQAINDSINAIAISELDGKITYINNSFIKMWGFEATKDVLGKSTISLWNEPDIANSIVDILFKDGSYIGEIEGKRSDSTIFDALLTASLIKDKSGKAIKIMSSFIDITDKKLAEIKLQQSNRFFEQALEMFCIAGFDSKFKLVNPAWTRILGWTKEEITSKPYIEFIHPDDVEVTINIQSTLVDGRELYNFENRYRHKDGSYRWLSWTSITYFDEQLMYGIARDITETKNIQLTLEKTEKHFKSIIENAHDGVVLLSKDGNMLYASPSALKMFGFDVNYDINLINTNDSTHPEDRSLVLTALYEVMNNKELVKTVEYRFMKKDGTWYWIESIISNKFDEPGIEALIINFRDIDKRKKAEDQLKERESLLTTFIENAPFEIWARDKNEVGILENHLIVEHFGSILGKRPDNSDCSEDIILKWQSNNERVMKGEIVSEEINYYYNDDIKTYHNILAPILVKGEFQGIAGFNIDITEKKKAEELLKASESLLRTFIENVPFEVWARDKNEVGILENQHLVNHFGSILGKTLDESGLNDEAIKILRAKNDRVKHGEIIIEEIEIFVESEKRIFQNIIIPILSDGNYDGIAGLSFDITDKKYSEMLQTAQYEIAKAIAGSNDFENIYDVVHSELSNLIDASNFYIAFYDDKTDILHSPYNKDEKDNITDWSAEKSLTGLVIKQNKTFHLRKEQIAELGRKGEIELVGKSSEAWIGVPLLTDNKPVGAIVVQSYINPNAYNHQSVEILEIIANQLTVFLERKKAVKELNDSIIQLNSIISNVPVVLYAIDKKGIFTLSEGKGLDALGLKPGQVVGLSAYEVYKDFPVICNTIKHCIKGNAIHTIFDVGDIIFDSWLSPIYDFTGNLTGIIGVSSNVTDKVKADKELENSHKSYKSIFDTISEFIFIQEENGSFIEINDVVTNFFGFTRDEIIGKNPEFLSAPDMNNFDIINSHFKDALQGKLRSLEFWCKTNSGEIFPTEIVFNVGEYFGKKVVIAVGRNISERKQAENDLRKAKERAEESDMLKTAFLANMSHEIRTPMNAILGFSHLLEANNLEPDEKKEYIALIHRRGHDLLNIINDILDISKIEANQMSIYQEPCNINNIIEEVYFTYRPLLNENDVEIRIGNIIPNLPSVISDPTRLQQILLNLVSNSVKFTRSGYIEIGYDIQTKGFIKFYVKDTGVGVPFEKHKLIFERFRQSDDNPLTRQFDGAGLGLTICKGLIQLMGGDIWVESKLGQGATFYFSIPFNRSVSAYLKHEHFDSNIFDWTGLCVLLVEDDPINVKLLVKILEKTNIEFLFAENGRKAIDLYRTTPFIDLILLDIQLPDIDGYYVANEILKLNSEAKIIAQTANAFSEDKRKSLEIGCKDYISKPIDQTKLLKIIDNVLKL